MNSEAGEQARDQHPVKRPHRALRVSGMILLAVVLGVAFLGHLSPDMQLQWENLMALCGF